MLILGAKAFAKQLIGAIPESVYGKIAFFDDINLDNKIFLNRFPVLHTFEEGRSFLENCGFQFALGSGGPKNRILLSKKGEAMNGKLIAVISPGAEISPFCTLGKGVSVLTGAIVEADAEIGDGCLININVGITHDCTIGPYCEISPGAYILGYVKIGASTFVGAGAIIQPSLTIGENVVIGAGTVVTRDIPDNVTVVGVPGRIMNKK